MNWIITTILASILFVVGQVFLNIVASDPLCGALWFMIAMGACSLIALLFTPSSISSYDGLYAGLGGVAFFVGNILWLYAISKATHISLVRILMACTEIILLLFVGILLYKQTVTVLNVVGLLLILTGIPLILWSNRQNVTVVQDQIPTSRSP